MDSKFDFYEGVKVSANTTHPKRRPMIGFEGFVVGKAQNEETEEWSYAVKIGLICYSFMEYELESNGKKGNRRDFYSGYVARVTKNGELKEVYYDGSIFNSDSEK